MSEFKLYIEAIENMVINETPPERDASAVVRAVLDDLARQLHDAGAPDAPIEDQLRAMLASHLALARAGEEMPSVREVDSAMRAEWHRHNNESEGVAWQHTANVIVAMFASHCAKLTQRATDPEAFVASHRALAEATEDMPSETRVAVLVGDAFADHQVINGGRVRAQAQRILNLFAPIFARLTQERDKARAVAAAERRVSEGLRVDAEADRQRAERAELELSDAKVLLSRRVEADQLSAANEEIFALRARIAELEASRGPGAGVVERLVEIAWEATRGVETAKERTRASVRAVITHLAAMGEEAWPDLEEVVDELNAGGASTNDARWLGELAHLLYRSRLSAVLGALRARVAELEVSLVAAKAEGCRVAEEAREMNRQAGEERRDLIGETLDK